MTNRTFVCNLFNTCTAVSDSQVLSPALLVISFPRISLALLSSEVGFAHPQQITGWTPSIQEGM